jgi:hypothetical protein
MYPGAERLKAYQSSENASTSRRFGGLRIPAAGQWRCSLRRILGLIFERVWAEEVLRESGRRIENILESITEDFYAVDREWRFTYVNERALLSAQRGRGEELKRKVLLGKNVWECFPEIVGTPFYHKLEVEAYSPCVTPGMRCTSTHVRKACRYTSRTSPSASGQKRNCATTPTCLKTSRTRSLAPTRGCS